MSELTKIAILTYIVTANAPNFRGVGKNIQDCRRLNFMYG